jgi:hypothetical protein
MPYTPELSSWVNVYTVSFLSVRVKPPPDTAARVAYRPDGGEYVVPLGFRPNPTSSPSG